jgi:hypothetical protein
VESNRNFEIEAAIQLSGKQPKEESKAKIQKQKIKKYSKLKRKGLICVCQGLHLFW